MLKTWDILNWEKINLVIKRHIITNVFSYIFLFLWIILSILIFYYYKSNLTYIWIIVFLQILLSLVYYFLINNELNLIIITSKKIIIINKKNFFEKNYNEFDLNNIEEIKAISKWLLQNIFNYWELIIKMKNNSLNYNLKFIPDPINKAKNIIDLTK
jgi:hypothetical protein